MSKINEYFQEIENKTRALYSVAEEARIKGLDPMSKVEVPLAATLAEKAVGLIGTIYPQVNNKQIVNRILELEKEFGKLDPAVYFKIAEEIAKEKFCKFSSLLEAMDAGIRVGFAYTTLGVVSSPIEGYTGIKVGKTNKNEDYLIAYFSGPIRSAGTTASCMVLMLIDYLRELFGYAKYDTDEKEVKRYVTENYDYHERITNLQYLPTEEEIAFLAKNIPIQISGEASEDKEVSNYKDLLRVETNFIRGGMCLIFSEGLAQKAQKGLRLWNSARSKGIKMTGWEFLDEYVKLHKKREKGSSDTSPTYIKDLVAGRPVFGHPSASGAFRFRYGRSRASGFSATSVHPATMGISDSFLSTGTQLKIEKPTKGCAISSCDGIDGPIVKMKNGSVRQFKDFDSAKKAYPDVEEIIYFGDLLVPFGDVMNRNYELIKSGYVEEWWAQELKKKEREMGENVDIENIFEVDFETAKKLSERFKIPLHPKHIFYWSQIKWESFLALIDWIGHGRYDEKLILPYNKIEKERFANGKRTLELLGVEQEVSTENIVINSEASKALLCNLGVEGDFENGINLLMEKIKEIKREEIKTGLDAVNKLSFFKIKDKAGTFIGSRMGRPEKAKLRKLIGSPNVLFPVGDEGGRMRSVNEALEKGFVKSSFPIYYCKKCGKESIYFKCACGSECEKLNYCKECKQTFSTEKCREHALGQAYSPQRVDIASYFGQAVKGLDLLPDEIPKLIKGVKGTSNKNHAIENLAKGVLRAILNLQVNKDGTIRFDATEMPLTHFKPAEVSMPVQKLVELGYERDIHNNLLRHEDQILELKPHDILLPCCPDSSDEKADDVFIRIAHFIDLLLVKFYKMKPFYNIRSREDLAGHLVVCMAPHNCAGVIGRIVGFSKTQTLTASPYMHAGMRRDCDGDEAAVMMLLDVLINFSREYLPAHRGGTQDAPLVLNTRLRAGEVDDQILDFELVSEYPLELYEKAEEGGHHSSEIKIETVKTRLALDKDPFTDTGFTHNSSDVNAGVLNSSYKLLPSMQAKVEKQMELVEKLRAVNTADVARLVIDRHFIMDIRCNLRKFSQQEFRCSKCNAKYRRPPLVGRCVDCGGKVIFTISEGSIVKYLEPALSLAKKYDVPPYVKQSMELTKSYIESIFGKDKEKQIALGKWF